MYDKCYFCLDQLPKLKKESTASFFVNFGGAGYKRAGLHYCTIICWSLLSWFCLSYQARSSTTTSSTYTVLLLLFFILYYNMLGWSFLFLGQPVLYYIVLWCGCVSPLRLGPPQHLQLIQLYYCSVLYCTIIYWVGASIFLGTTCIVLYCCVV